MAGNLQGGQRIDEAGRQPAEPAVAEAGVGLDLRAPQSSPARVRAQVLATSGSTPRLTMLLVSERPMRNSIDR